MIRENQMLLNHVNMFLDAAWVFLSFLMGYWIRFDLMGGSPSVPFRAYVAVAVGLIPLHLLTYAFAELYTPQRKKRLRQELKRLLAANALDFILLQMTFFILKDIHFSRGALGIFFVLENAGLGMKRVLLRKFLHSIRIGGYNQKYVVIVGQGRTARDCVRAIRHSPELGYTIAGCVGDGDGGGGLIRLCGFDKLGDLLEGMKPDEVIVGLDVGEYEKLPQIIQACERTGTKVSLVPFYAQYMPAHPQFDSLNGLPLINLRRIPLDNLANAFLKRTMDVVGSLCLIVLTSPIMLLAAVGVRCSSPGPVIFRQARVGLNKREFCMYKFRSMRENAREDTAWTTDQDSRKTRFGAFIRKFSIDELPQFFNVLKGDMSLVGPRPEIPHFVEQFKDEIPLYMVKHQVRPGITGWAQVNGLRGDTSVKERVEHDIYYIENWSALLDIKILFLTLFKGIVNQEKLN